MKNKYFFGIAIVCFSLAVAAFGQTTVLINDPVAESAKMDGQVNGGEKVELSAAEQSLMDKSILPKARKILLTDGCEETVEVAGVLSGAFTKAGSQQTLIFYQFCQVGNGLGTVGVAVIENGKVVANYVCSVAGWSLDAKALPDINQNGVDEIALYYSGGMHQGSGGTGVDIMEISNGGLKGIGWFQADGYTETGPVFGYKVTVKPGKVPVFYKEKYIQNAAGKWRKSGAIAPLKLTEVSAVFDTVK